jgi:hypothetical protein
MEACVREDCRPSRLVPSYLVAYLSQPAMTSMFVSDLQQLIGRTLSIRRVYMVTIYHRGCHTHRIARRRPATPNASSVTLQELIQFAYACGLSRARALPVPTPLAVFLWRDLHSVRHPSTSLALPTHITTTGLDWTRLFSPSGCNLQLNMVLAVHMIATPPSHYHWLWASQPLPSHLYHHTRLPANMSRISAVR